MLVRALGIGVLAGLGWQAATNGPPAACTVGSAAFTSATLPAAPPTPTTQPSDEAERLYRQGQEFLDRRQTVEAIGRLEQAADLAPQRPRYQASLAHALWEGGRRADALLAFRRAAEVSGMADSWADLGRAQDNMGQSEAALSSAARALQIDDHNSEGLALAAALQTRTGNHAQAAEYLQRLLDQRRQSRTPHRGPGLRLRRSLDGAVRAAAFRQRRVRARSTTSLPMQRPWTRPSSLPLE